MKRYQVTFYQAGRYSTDEICMTKAFALLIAKEYMDELKNTARRIGCKKIGNLSKDLRQSFEHPAFGIDSAVYIHRQKHSRITGWFNAD